MRPFDSRIHQALDGEIARETLPAEVRQAVERLERAAALLAEAVPKASLEPQIMGAVRRAVPSRAERLVRWLVTPRALTLRFRPAWSLALAAAVAVLTLFPSSGGETPVLADREGIVQFVGRFPGAHSVHVVGTFNDWSTGALPLEDRDHDGVWRAVVVLPTGAYEYMFVVDGERWVPDHLADRLVDDDFGRKNSIVIVRPARR